jgi:hypothetical protein
MSDPPQNKAAPLISGSRIYDQKNGPLPFRELGRCSRTNSLDRTDSEKKAVPMAIQKPWSRISVTTRQEFAITSPAPAPAHLFISFHAQLLRHRHHPDTKSQDFLRE